MSTLTSSERGGLTREILFHPAFDKRDPDPHKSYGIHGVEMTWYLKGPEGAIQFVVYTGWHLPHVQSELDSQPLGRFRHLGCHPSAADIGYHSRIPRYNGQTLMSENCSVIGGPCYYDGSSLQAEDILLLLIEKGGEAVWTEMEERYRDKLTPAPAEPTAVLP